LEIELLEVGNIITVDWNLGVMNQDEENINDKTRLNERIISRGFRQVRRKSTSLLESNSLPGESLSDMVRIQFNSDQN
jgi:hypothetical protein